MSYLVNFSGWLREAEADMTPLEQIEILSNLLHTGEHSSDSCIHLLGIFSSIVVWCALKICINNYISNDMNILNMNLFSNDINMLNMNLFCVCFLCFCLTGCESTLFTRSVDRRERVEGSYCYVYSAVPAVF